jgi:hypothetical protein
MNTHCQHQYEPPPVHPNLRLSLDGVAALSTSIKITKEIPSALKPSQKILPSKLANILFTRSKHGVFMV